MPIPKMQTTLLYYFFFLEGTRCETEVRQILTRNTLNYC